jgi:predicted nuclease of predicted toxin-antitoxin system
LKLLFDANLAPRLAKRLADFYPGSAHVGEFALQIDRAIWDFAGANHFVIVSKDSDFYHLSTVFGAPPKVVWLRIGNAGTEAVLNLLSRHAADLDQFEADGEASLLILPLDMPR